MSQKKYLSLERLAEYDALLKAKIAQDDASTLDAAKEYADGLIEGVNTSITNITNGDIVVKEAEHATSADSAVTADSATSAESATKATQDGNGAVIADTYETKADASAKLDEAKEYTDTLKTYVGTIPEGATATDVVGYIQEKTSGIASEGAMTELSNRVGIVEGKVSTIEGDYLTSADKTELQTNIDTVSSAVELLTNGVDAETVDGVNDLIAYVNEHGAEVTGMKADIKANADALAELAPVAKTGSWNDLADKPFGDELKISNTMAEHQELTFNKNFLTSTPAASITLVDRQYYNVFPSGKYLIVFDGVSYILDSESAGTTPPTNFLGNAALGAGEIQNDVTYEDNGIPFLVLHTPGGRFWTVYTVDPTITHTIELHIVEGTFKQIEEKFIPNTIARSVDVENAFNTLAPVAHSGSWNDLEDKPTEFIGRTIIYGRQNTNNTTSAGMWHKVSDETPTLEEFAYGCKLVRGSNEVIKEFTIDDITLEDFLDDGEKHINCKGYFYVLAQGAYVGGALGNVPAGTYFAPVDANGVLSQIEGDINYNLIINGKEVIKDEHIPDSIARVSDIPVVDLTPYETKEDASAKLDEAKAYVDEKFDAVEAKASANETAIGNLNTAVAGKAAQGDLDSAVERVAALEAWHEGFEECSEADIRLLFEQ